MLKKMILYLLFTVIAFGIVGGAPTFAQTIEEKNISDDCKSIVGSAKKLASESSKDFKVNFNFIDGKYKVVNNENVYTRIGYVVVDYNIEFEVSKTGYYDCFVEGNSDKKTYIRVGDCFDMSTNKKVLNNTFSVEDVKKNAIWCVKGHKYSFNCYCLVESTENNSLSMTFSKNNDLMSTLTLGENEYNQKQNSKQVYHFKPDETTIYAIKNNDSGFSLDGVNVVNVNNPNEYYEITYVLDNECEFELKAGNEYYVCVFVSDNKFDNQNTSEITVNNKFVVTKKEIKDFKIEKDFDVFTTLEKVSDRNFKVTVNYKDGSQKTVNESLNKIVRCLCINTNLPNNIIDVSLKEGNNKIVFEYFGFKCSIDDIEVLNGYEYAIKNGKKFSNEKRINDIKEVDYFYFVPDETDMYNWYDNLWGLEEKESLVTMYDCKNNAVKFKKNEGYLLKKGNTYVFYLTTEKDYLLYDTVLITSKNHQHTYAFDKEVKPTSTKTGLTAGLHCSECGKIFVQQKVIPKKVVIKLNKTKLTLKKGKSSTLKITGTKAKVTWKTGNKKIAKVNSKGKVTAMKKGKVNIYATVGGKVYKCLVVCK